MIPIRFNFYIKLKNSATSTLQNFSIFTKLCLLKVALNNWIVLAIKILVKPLKKKIDDGIPWFFQGFSFLETKHVQWRIPITDQPEKRQRTDATGCVLQPVTTLGSNVQSEKSSKFASNDLSCLTLNSGSGDDITQSVKRATHDDITKSVKCEKSGTDPQGSSVEKISERLKDVTGPLDIRSPNSDNSGQNSPLLTI